MSTLHGYIREGEADLSVNRSGRRYSLEPDWEDRQCKINFMEKLALNEVSLKDSVLDDG